MEIILPTRFQFLFTNSIQVLVKCDDNYCILFINVKHFLIKQCGNIFAMYI